MPRVRILPKDLVNKIAAGEVIERPASVVKELVENALDAGAGEIRIEIGEGGRRLIRVSDDGSGIDPEDLPRTFEPHATSKLECEEDLFRVATLGFRGEALASIGSVARVRILSRVPESIEAAELVMEHGRKGVVSPAAGPVGTTVEVRDIFQNVPVRRKFLRSVHVEFDHVMDMVRRFSIAHPSVRFELRHDDEQKVNLPAGDVPSRIERFFGEEVRESLREVRHDGDPVRFSAWLTPARFARTNAKSIHIFLNGRFIRDRVLSHAIQEAYRELLPHGRYPVVFLFLESEPGEVDVNVHPTKIEVRFRRVWKVHDLLVDHLRRALMKSELDTELGVEELRLHSDASPVVPRPRYQEMVDFFSGETATRTETIDPPLLTTGRRFFQVHDRYIVEEADDGIRLIDQHALHERVLLDRFRKEYSSGDIARQRLLLPAVVPVTDLDSSLLEKHRALIESVGIEFGDFGPGSVAVRAVPALLGGEDPATLLNDLLEKLRDHGESEREVGEALPLLEEALEFLACRGAIRFGRRMGPEELEALLTESAGMDFSATCAHGRPTAIRLSFEELERLFRRK
jgi:DNA mismatch repair protein MutL